MTINYPGAEQANFAGCPLFCPGCHDRTVSPAKRLAEKERYIRKILSPWQELISPARQAPADRRRAYRERVCLSAEWKPDGWRLGLKHRRNLVPVHDCPVHSSRVNRTIDLLSGLLPPKEQFPLAYYLQSGSQVTLVVKTRDLPNLSWLTTRVTDSLKEIGVRALWLHLHPAAGRRVTIKSGWHLAWGERRSKDNSGLIYGPTAFQQLIPELAEAALDEAERFVSPGAGDFVLDLYSGLGNSLRRWSGRARQVVGLERCAESVACAEANAPGAVVLRGTGKNRLPQLTALLPPDGNQRLLYANPPRVGIEPEVLEWIVTVFKPARLACLSCNAVSLKRDLTRLTDAGYRAEQIIPFDFFPETRYLEMLALLERK